MKYVLVLSLLLLLAFLSEYKIYVRRVSNTRTIYNLKSFQMALSWIIPFFGLLGYCLVYSNIIGGDENLKEIIIKVSDVLVIGGFVGFLSNISQSFGIFKKELQEIVFSENFLATRNDIKTIWKNTSKAMFQQRFPDISEDLLSIILEQYINKEEYSYYSNYRIITDMQWADEDKKFVIVRDCVLFDLVFEKEGDADVTFKTWINGVRNLKKDIDYYCHYKCWIDGEEQTIKTKDSYFKDNNQYFVVNKVIVHNKDKRQVHRVRIERNKRYLFDLDYDISFRAKYIVKDMTITLNLPDDIKATFICRGTPKDFIKVKESENTVEYMYKGLILHRQGYIFALHRKQSEIQ